MHIPPEFFELHEDTAHVLFLGLADHREALEAGLNALHPSERERAARYANPRNGLRYACTRGLLRQVLGRLLNRLPADITFSYGAFGKPELSGPGGIAFNLSHCGDQVALAVSRGGRVGVDLESRMEGDDCLAVARQCFSAQERLELEQGTDMAQAFCAIWVRKEAVVKAAGRGLDTMQTFCTCKPVVPLPDERGIPIDWHLSEIPMPPGQYMALASERGGAQSRCFRL